MNGFTKIPNELMRNPLLSPTEKTVWGVIASMAPGFNPTIGQLCTMVQCHRDTWRAAVKRLERFGMVAVKHRPNGVTYTVVEETSKWHITPDAARYILSHGFWSTMIPSGTLSGTSPPSGTRRKI